jgi:hypothetical protein
MLRLYDPRSGRLDEPPAGRLLRVHVHGPSPRAHVTADLLRRVAERRGRAILVSRDDVVLGWDETELNIPPAEVRADPATDLTADTTTDPTAATADVHVVDTTGGNEGAGTVAGHPEYLRCLMVPPVSGDPPATADPLTLRFALLRARYRDPADIDGAAVRRATDTLGEWRRLVARWAEAPSKPMCAEYVAEAMAGLDDDLDTPTALGVLARLAENPEIPPGSKFETFSYLDMVLALDLVRDVGR